MEASLLSFSLALLLLNSLTLISSTPLFNITTDQESLLAFKSTITSDPYGILIKNWSISTSVCRWIGVSCGLKHHRVTSLNVSNFGLVGAIAPHIGNLTFLQSLDISFNKFNGGIPSELSKLRRLDDINMRSNSLEGEIPSWLGALSQLRSINFRNNTFLGRIPSSLFNLSSLQILDMGYNFLDGKLPDEIGNSSFLEQVILVGNRFSGRIPNGVLNISSLIRLDMRSNLLSGELPNEICCNTDPKLQRLYLSDNQLFGEIPVNIYKCKEIEHILLHENRLSGKIHGEIGGLPKLGILYLQSNNFEGPIPKQVGNLSLLTQLFLFNNKLTGELPEEVSNLAYLQVVSMRNNSLSGPIPYSIFNMTSLQYLVLSFNRFSGTLPSYLGLSLSYLQELYLSHNTLSGELPNSITNASMLKVFEITNNSITGPIPNFGSLRDLRILRIWGNKLSGAESPTQEIGFFSSLTNCRYLENFDVSYNPLIGILPTSIGNFSSSLQVFWASGCNISGVIPPEIGNLSSLQILNLEQNKQMHGSIPRTIGKLKQLQRLYLGGNQLQGSIPNDLCQVSRLGELDLSGNVFTHEIPQCLGDLQGLRDIKLDSNKLSSNIPSNLWNLRDILTFNLSSNYLSGELSSKIGSLKAVYQLDLSSNNFVGHIPSSIEGCQSLEILSLSNNKFTGPIPESLGNVKGLSTLDLSYNNLSGLIPKSLQELQFLKNVNMSYNNLEGEIPNEGCFGNFTSSSFVHNYALCGATRFEVPSCSKDQKRSRSKSILELMKYVIPSLILAIIFVIIILMLLRRRKQKWVPISTDEYSVAHKWRRISYAELEQGTSSFSETNLLGRGSYGSVFKGTLFDGLNVAVKVFNLQLEGAIKSFDTESEILSSIRHRNLVRIIGCCSNSEFKALVLEYMPNGSVDKWLYSDNYCLDLIQRLNITIDVASALEYLHHGHEFPVVHCDIKPSNVLLNQDMTAHVSDFGISKLVDNEEAGIQTRTLATIGYAAPEYGMEGKVSINGDVYSFGILILEMFTSKRPTDNMFNGEMSLKQWVDKALQENGIIEVLDPGLLSTEDQDFSTKQQCVLSIFELAMKCLVVHPEERINMVEAGNALHKIKARIEVDRKDIDKTT